MFDRTASTWQLMKASWKVLKSDKALMVFPLFSSLSMFLVVASFASSYWWAHNLWPDFSEHYNKDEQPPMSPLGYLVMFGFYFVNYFIISYFNSGLIFCALSYMNGQQVSVKEGFRQANKRLPLILGWALLAATIGMVLKMIAERSGIIGNIVSGIIGIAFSLTSFLVIPVMVAENKGPVDALKESANLFTKTWGKQLKGGLGFGAVFILFWLAMMIVMPIVIIALHSSVILMSLAIGVMVVGMMGLILAQVTLGSIFQAALYLYAKSGIAPIGYDKDLMHSAVREK